MNVLQKLLTSHAPRRRLAGAPPGFTAIELLVVIAIVAILAAIAAPSFKYVIERWRVRDTQEAMTSTLYLARSEAIKRGGNVVLEKRASGSGCVSDAQHWNCGWTVYFADDGNVQIQSFPEPKNTIVELASAQAQLTFDRWGNPGSAVASFTLYPESGDATSPAARTLCVSGGGRIDAVQGDSTKCPK
ncbi:MAG: GspH/FimT family protein [Desulfovibrionaceae bacterium]|jgi:type IV fimbrial biogenesis protein FimT|nr:GspH/FimT family protein [Desulfovibrionaceae bacterium]